jgi:predicted DNA repair protein MutK
MATSSLLALIDDIATLLDDVAVMTKVAARQGAAAADDVAAMTQLAARKTAGVLGDDLALNAQQVTGVRADRELPVVWAVAKGSLRNKAILVPAALAISAVAPIAITPLLMLGGLFLCYEGAEKLLHALQRRTGDAEQHHAELLKAVADEQVDLVAFEQDKIKGAVRTDFILSAEIIVITLGTVAEVTFARQVSVLVGISVIMTVGVYGLVAGIVKLDDAGLYLRGRAAAWQQALGRAILLAAPWLMKTLSVVGTAAMFLVGGGILLHGIPALGHGVDAFAATLGWVGALLPSLAGTLAGLLAGGLVVGAVTLWSRLRGGGAAASRH